MIVLITVGTIGTDANNFNLYSNSTGPWVLFDSGVTRTELLPPGYEVVVPDFTTQIKIESTGVCTNSIIVDVLPTTTTTSTTSSTTTTTTTLVALSTYCFQGVYSCGDPEHVIAGHLPDTGKIIYWDEFGVEHTEYYCLEDGIVTIQSSAVPLTSGMNIVTCPTTTTTTTTP